MTTFDLAIKTRAKAIFCQRYSYPAIPFRSIGRNCFKSAMAIARQEAAQLAYLKAIPAPIRAARMADLELSIGHAWLVENYGQAKARVSKMAAELAALRAVA